jgi:trans-L-3-hydroxyproline dehydratase
MSTPTQQPFWQKTEDYHTAGEPFRIVRDLPQNTLTKGLTVSQQRHLITTTPSHPLDLLRRSLCHEPRGHADMYGGFITPPDDAGAHFGVLFFHKDGFSTACGHGTIALGYWAVANGIVEIRPGGKVDVVVDVPSGRVVARVISDDGGDVVGVDFVNVGSCQISSGDEVSIDWAGERVLVKMDLSFAGAVYACVDVADLGLSVEPSRYQTFTEIARKIKAQRAGFLYQDKYDIYGVCFFEHQGDSEDAIWQKNVVVFADGQIDRSPCGSGTCARLAVLLAQGRVSKDKRLVHESIIGSKFEAYVMETTESKPFPSCVPRVRGTARLVGKMEFYIDPTDPIYPGFVLR